MSLFKHAMVSGINDALVDSGIVSWPNEAVGFEVCSKIAADLSGPELLPEGGLAKESALLIGERLKEASDTLIANGYTADASTVLRTKQASQMDFTDRAAMVAEACMSKAAGEASLTSVGPNTAESAVQTDQHAALDQKNRPTNKYLMGVGRTMFPNGGVVGQQMMHPERQKGPSISNSLTSLDKQASGGYGGDPAYGYEAVADAAEQAAAADPGRMQKLREMLSRGAGHVADYGRSAAKNPFAGVTGQGFTSGAKALGGNLARHPGTHAAALAAALYGVSKIPGALRKDREDTDAEMSQMAENNPEMAAYLASKQANEDMAAGDLGGAAGEAGEDPGRLERAMMFLRGIKNKIPGFRPSPEAQVAAAGLGEAGTPGMEVMAHVLDTVKTASDAEDVLQQILHHQGEAGELASPEMVEAIEHMMAQQDHEEAKEAAFYEECVKIASDATESPSRREAARKFIADKAKKVTDYAKEHGSKAVDYAKEHGSKAVEYARKNKLRTAGGALAATGAAAGTAYGVKKLYDKVKGKKEESESKEAALYEYLKQAAFGPGELDPVRPLSEAERAARAARIARNAEEASKNAVPALRRAYQAAGRHPVRTGLGALGLAGGAYGVKKLYDHMTAPKAEEQAKAAALYDYLKAAAEGSLTDVGENTEESAAHTDSVAELDMRNRAPGAYLAGVGNTQMPNKGQVYAVEPAHQDSPVHTDNLPTNETKSAELAYVSNFRKIASELGPYLPATMARDEKVAHLQTLMGMPPSERAGYLTALRAG